MCSPGPECEELASGQRARVLGMRPNADRPSYVAEFVDGRDEDLQGRIQELFEQVARLGRDAGCLKTLEGSLIEVRMLGQQIRFSGAWADETTLILHFANKKAGKKWNQDDVELAKKRRKRHDAAAAEPDTKKNTRKRP